MAQAARLIGDTMFFVISKVLAYFTLPSNDILLLMLLGVLLLFTRFARAGRRLLVLGCVLMIVFGVLPTGRMLLSALEERFPAWDASRGEPAGFIILGGSIDPEISDLHKTTAISGAAERLTAVPLLAKRYPNAKFIFTGGNASVFGGLAEADYVVPLFESFGVPRERVAIETESRNTAENAEFTRKIVLPKPGERWVIVTSAFHMPRSIGSFRAAGFDVEAYPVDWRILGPASIRNIPANFTSGFGYTDVATREYIGMLMYWLTGRSSELFPRPR
jgi:uncharacterized SAM-binding protein YcdF (DUF218 family)